MFVKDVKEALKRLRAGEAVAVPTETVYGLAARIDDEAALKSVFTIKGRPFFDPLIVHVASRAQAGELTTEWPEVYDLLARHFWPGPLTLIARKSDRVSDLITAGLDTVAIRCPRHPLTLELLQQLNVPFAAPSANRFGRTSPTLAAHVEKEFDGRVPVLDGGACEVGLESTVVSVASENKGVSEFKILRPGGVSVSQLRKVLDEAKLKFTIEHLESSASPGHLKHHYQPENPLYLLQDCSHDTELPAELARQNPQILTLPDQPEQAARILYSEFRRLSASSDRPIVLCQMTHQKGDAWDAIWDRAKRAASKID